MKRTNGAHMKRLKKRYTDYIQIDTIPFFFRSKLVSNPYYVNGIYSKKSNK